MTHTDPTDAALPDAALPDAEVANHRRRATGLGPRRPAGSLADAAFCALQDSAPRAALFALHARVAGVGPDSWADDTLAQIWFRRADFVVPRAEIGLFTLGASPRDEARRRALDDLARRVVDALGAGSPRTPEVARRSGVDAMLIRSLSVTGRIHIRWDARTVEVVAATPDDIDPEDARRALARRFVAVYGPATPRHLERWAGLERADADATWRAIEAELVPVRTARGRAWLLDGGFDDAPVEVAPADRVRLLPDGDPYLYRHGGLAVPAAPPDLGPGLLAAGVPSRVVNGLTGRVLVDGRIAASWGRRAAAFTLAAWDRLAPGDREAIEAAVAGTEAVLGAAPSWRWLR